MFVAETITSLREQLASLRSQKIALVPTMGNLHQGHLDLVEKARQLASTVVVSIFVNPLQFGAGEDLDNYPRTLQEDMEKLEALGVDLLFAPAVAEVYGEEKRPTTKVVVPELPELWCGASRPDHFDGVTTVVNKLFNMVQPDVAVFGQKDFQQLAVIRRMVDDLNMPVEIVGVETRREEDGLAMSSRNGYLTPNEREIAPKLREVLINVRESIKAGSASFDEIVNRACNELDQAGFRTDYLGVCRVDSLKPVHSVAEADGKGIVVLAAAYLGKARLIDNIVI